MKYFCLVCVSIFALTPGICPAQDWPTWGGSPSRNMVSNQSGLPLKFALDNLDTPDATKSTNLKWITKIGSQSYGNPTVASGRVYLGTNNEPGLVKEREGDYGVVACLDEQTGKLIWQLTSPKLKVGDACDFELVGNCSSPTVQGDRVYFVTNRCEVVCVDALGLANGNDGEFQSEAQYIAGPGNPPVELLPTDADILWVYDMRDELGIFPHQMTSSATLFAQDRLYVTTSNGRDWSEEHLPSPDAPALICLDPMTGKLLGQEKSGISLRTFKCNWSSPAYGEVNGQGMVIFGGDDGFCYAFDPMPVDGMLKEIWRFDCNPPEYRAQKHGTAKGPSGIVATPVIHDGQVFVAIGQDPDAGDGSGALVCINASGSGDITQTNQAWINKTIGRSLSTVSIRDGLLFTADLGGSVFCFDVKTGEKLWEHDAEGSIWGSPLLAGDRVYIGTQYSVLWVLSASREKKVLADMELTGTILSSPVSANSVLYIMTDKWLIAAKE